MSPLAYLTVTGSPLKANSVAFATAYSTQSLLFVCCWHSIKFCDNTVAFECTRFAMTFSTPELRLLGALWYM